MAITQQRFTFDDLLALPDDGHFYELLDGELCEMSSPDPDHAAAVEEISFWLGRAQRAGFGKARAAPLGVLLDAGFSRANAPQPDVFFIRQERAAIITDVAVEGVPDLIIEVLSESTRQRDLPSDRPDRGQKWKLYERFGVPRYWIADPQTRTLAQYALHAGRYEQPALQRGDAVLRSPLFPGILLPVRQLFADVRQPEVPLHGLGPFRIPGRSAPVQPSRPDEQGQ